MIAQGYASGYEDKTLRPTQQVTREEFEALFDNGSGTDDDGIMGTTIV